LATTKGKAIHTHTSVTGGQQTPGTFVFGAYGGAGIHITVGNGSPALIKGPFKTINANGAFVLEAGGFSYSYSGQLGTPSYVWQLTISPPLLGVGFGGEVSAYQTNTCIVTGTNKGC